MPSKGLSKDSDRGTNNSRQSQQPYVEGVAKATLRYKAEQANKIPSARTIKALEKKVRAKERKESEEYLARKAMWKGEQSTSTVGIGVKRAKENKRKDRKFEQVKETERDFD